MASVDARAPVEPGEPAPDFALPAVEREGKVSLADYRGRTPLLLAIERGLWCPFCRRHIAQLAATSKKLLELGVETLVVVSNTLERVRLYTRFRPAGVPLAADPERVTHRAYGLPNFTATPELEQALQTVRVDPTGELEAPVPITEINGRLNEVDRFDANDDDREGLHQQLRQPQLTGQLLIDRGGTVRWVNVECAREGLAGAGKFPTDEEILAAARSL